MPFPNELEELEVKQVGGMLGRKAQPLHSCPLAVAKAPCLILLETRILGPIPDLPQTKKTLGLGDPAVSLHKPTRGF